MQNDTGGMFWKMKRNQLVCVIRDVGKQFNDNEDFLEGYIVEQVAVWSTSMKRLDFALKCFKSLKEVK